MAEWLEIASVCETDTVLYSGPISTSIEVKYIGLDCLGTRYTALASLDPDKLSHAVTQQLSTLARVRHPHVLQFLGLHSSPPDPPLLVHELLPTRLSQCLDHSLLLRQALKILHHLVLALSYLHSHGLVHGDISAANIHLTSDMTAKLAEVGTMHVLSAVQSDYTQPTALSDIRSFGDLMHTVINSSQDFSAPFVREKASSVALQCLQASSSMDTPTLLTSMKELLNSLPKKCLSSELKQHVNFMSTDSALSSMDPDARPGLTPSVSIEDPLQNTLKEEIDVSQLQNGCIEWRRCADLPVGMFQAAATYLNRRVYVGGGNTECDHTAHIVYEYDLCSDDWRALPPAKTALFGLGQLDGELVLVGGRTGVCVSDLVLVFNPVTQRWKLSLPPLRSPRYSPTCLSLEGALIVFGGLSQAGSVDTSIEILHPDQFAWTVVGCLPRSASLCYPSSTNLGDSFVLLGGYSSDTACSVTRSTHSIATETLLESEGLAPYIWQSLPKVPHLQATAGTLHGHLLSMGGCTQPYSTPVHNSVHALSSSHTSWEYIGELPHSVCHATSVAVDDEILLVGGWVEPGKFKRSMAVYRGQFITQT